MPKDKVKTTSMKLIFRRWASSRSYAQQKDSAILNVSSTLQRFDRSSYILSAYVPKPCRDCYSAIRAFNVEISKITNKHNYSSLGGVRSVDLKFKFWLDFLDRVFSDPYSEKPVNEPSMFLIRDGLRQGLNLDVQYFQTIINSRKQWLANPIFKDIDSICALGEGTNSQLLYLEQALLLSPDISPSAISLLQQSATLQSLISDVAAHIGQASSIANNLLSLSYYAKQEYVPLPVDVMAKFSVSQDAVIEYAHALSRDKNHRAQDLEEKLKNVIFEVSTRANDHILTSRHKLGQIRQEIAKTVEKSDSELVKKYSKSWRRGIPDVIFVPFMNSIPVEIFLKNLEKKDFNIFHSRMTNNNMNRWRVVWKSFYNYRARQI